LPLSLIFNGTSTDSALSAKSVFQVHGVDGSGQVVIRRQLKDGGTASLFLASGGAFDEQLFIQTANV
jgi:hypothetical protein